MNNIKLDELDKIKFKHSLKTHSTRESIVSAVVEKVKALPDYVSLKYNQELLIFVCSALEILCKLNKIKVDKLECLVEIYKECYEIDTRDEVVLNSMVDFVHKNDLILTTLKNKIMVRAIRSLIKKVSLLVKSLLSV
jgi:hypothetical protein